jgi:hypothetical protein
MKEIVATRFKVEVSDKITGLNHKLRPTQLEKPIQTEICGAHDDLVIYNRGFDRDWARNNEFMEQYT